MEKERKAVMEVQIVEVNQVLLVPVFFAFVQGWEHEGHNAGHIVTDQTQDVLVIPKIQRSFCHLFPPRTQEKTTALPSINNISAFRAWLSCQIKKCNL